MVLNYFSGVEFIMQKAYLFETLSQKKIEQILEVRSETLNRILRQLHKDKLIVKEKKR
ncbi:MAG: hypothetical protein U9N52_04030 [Campylobacterota bacterium]|nr:hypothetical protein [Campylobacterota bacterium]